ncbi:DNA-binding transcriptional regulator, MarR family [Pseudomonas citronellolis]|uniref:DNA-binding transcriptional regulator, MarR family n=1 Tax=Pseudomonas citronellolis TaxID=53408 RepID=A0AAQ1KFH6_9PSED|nr:MULTISPECIES: MarR family transcriptional regulator [Pseudomonas]MBB1608527.1 MarR family transcriptional regulator [Pseudomonas sp. UMC76]MBB1637218.1 MarR family transcriptional regulator [Pseudomonas sp. UME83]MCL6690583.1 MarR family transcriptional regulator [Pseudomonas sp. R3.Fl]MCP1606826.1 DNA-binding MarR family transcriptional regulator [Pseudomonas citronellolis]MCP1657618.1 DNA-binding MarR family transcriptional regulator [Pseudomonas citronellolis]
MDHYRVTDFPFRGSIGQLLGLAAILKDRLLDKHLIHLDITAAQFKVLFFIGQNRANTPGELCRELSIDSGSMTRMLDRLAKKDLLLRQPCPNDRRSVRLQLSPAGEAVNAQAPQIAVRAMNELVGCLNPEELLTLTRLLDKILASHGVAPGATQEK